MGRRMRHIAVTRHRLSELSRRECHSRTAVREGTGHFTGQVMQGLISSHTLPTLVKGGVERGGVERGRWEGWIVGRWCQF